YQFCDEAVFVYPRGTVKKIERAAPAALDSAQHQALASAIEALGAEEFAARERASNSILSLGPAAIPALQHASRTTRDPELHLRARTLAATLASTQLFQEEPAVTEHLRGMTGLIDFEVDAIAASECATHLQQVLRGKNVTHPPLNVHA